MTSIDDLLASERARPGYTDEAKSDMWRGIEKSIAMGAAAGGAAAAATAAAAAAKTTTVAKLATWKVGALGVGALVVGTGIGALGHARLAEPKVVTVEKVVTTTTTVTVTTPAAPPPVVSIESLPTARAPSVPAATTSAAAPTAKDPDLARERTLLDMARTALGRGDAASALAALDSHTKEFKRSQLAEEREVLAVQALASAGRRDEATRRAAAFHATFPKSALGAVVDDAVK